MSMNKPRGYSARLETRHYSFEAHGHTEDEAATALNCGLYDHGVECGIEEGWQKDYEDARSVGIFKPGAAFRDGREIHSHVHAYKWTREGAGSGMTLLRCACGDEIEKDVS